MQEANKVALINIDNVCITVFCDCLIKHEELIISLDGCEERILYHIIFPIYFGGKMAMILQANGKI